MSGLATLQPVAAERIAGAAVTDITATLAAHRRTLDALSASSCAALQCAASVAAANLAAIRQLAAEVHDHRLQFAACDESQLRAARQLASFQDVCEQAATNAEQLGRLIQQAQGSAAILLGPRGWAAMDFGREHINGATMTYGKTP